MLNRKLSVIVPVYKAESFIAKNLDHIKEAVSKYFPNYEVIVVIDGELDRSTDEAMKVSGVKIVSCRQNHGKGHALKIGFERCSGDYVTFVDCDMDIDPEQLKNFLPYMATADMVIGSKRHPFSKLEYPLKRRMMSRAFQWYSWFVLGTNIRDTQSGLKMIKREVLDVVMPLVLVKRYAFDLELCFLAQKHGFRVVEAPIYIDYHFNGSGINFKNIFGMFLDVLAIGYRHSILSHYKKKYWEEKGWKDIGR